MFRQIAEVNTLKPRGLSPVNWSNRGQIRRAQCPPGTGGGKADLRCPIQGSGQVILVPWQCDNLKLYRQKFASECSQPHQMIYPPSDFCHGLSGRWCSSSELPIVSVGAPTGVLVTLIWSDCLCTWAFLCLGRFAGVGLGTCRGFPSVLLEEWGVSQRLGRWDISCLSMGRSPHGPHKTLMKSQHHWQPQDSTSAHTCFGFFQLPPSEICVFNFTSSLHFPIAKCCGKGVNEGRHEQICKRKKYVPLLGLHKLF